MPVSPDATNSVERPTSSVARCTSKVEVILSMALAVPTVSAIFGLAPKPALEKSGMSLGVSRTSQIFAPGMCGARRWWRPLMISSSASAARREGLHPFPGQLPACRREPDEDRGRREFEFLLERADYRGVAT